MAQTFSVAHLPSPTSGPHGPKYMSSRPGYPLHAFRESHALLPEDATAQEAHCLAAEAKKKENDKKKKNIEREEARRESARRRKAGEDVPSDDEIMSDAVDDGNDDADDDLGNDTWESLMYEDEDENEASHHLRK